MYMYNSICINKVFCSKTIDSTSSFCFSIFTCIKDCLSDKEKSTSPSLDEVLVQHTFWSRNFNTIKQCFVMGLRHITNFLVTNTVINTGARGTLALLSFLRPFQNEVISFSIKEFACAFARIISSFCLHSLNVRLNLILD